MSVPGYWMYETSGVLAPVVRKYLAGDVLGPVEVGTMRAYLRQWVAATGFVGSEVDELRRDVERIVSTSDVRAWLDRAIDAGIDPL